MKLAGQIPFTDPGLSTAITNNGKNKSLLKDEILINPGDEVIYIPIVTSGVLRIIREDEGGNEFFLYHLYPGQTCALAINCCQAGKKSAVKAIAEENSQVILIPANLVDEWFKFAEWKLFINNTYALRFTELISVIDLIAFHQMDQQLMRYLLEKSRALKTKTISITHQEIAEELHSQREAISRLLRTMERKQLVKLGRNKIQIL